MNSDRDPLLYYSDDDAIINDADSASETDDQRVTEVTFEDAVNFIGLGRFHIALLVICGWANASDAVEIMCLSLILPSVQCHLGLTSAELGWLSAIIFLGMMIGGYLWGSMSDTVGRKRIIVHCLLLNGLFGLLSSFSTSFWWFLVCRFISGLGVGGSIPVLFSYYIEFQPTKTRGRMLSLLATFWMIGGLMIAGLGWILIPHEEWKFSVFGFKLQRWRVFLIISTFVCLSSALLLLILPESPKFLLQKRKPKEAFEILRNIYQFNCTSRTGKDFPFDRLLTDDSSSERPPNEPRQIFRSAYNQTKELLKPSLLRMTLIILLINFSLAFGFYGLTMWLPELFSRARAGGADGPICQNVDHLNATVTSGQNKVNCSIPPDPSVFRDNFIIYLSNFPGNAFTVLLLDKMGRKPIFVLSMFIAAISAFMVYFVSTQSHVLIMSCIFGCVATICYNSSGAIGSEIFPTHLRSTAIGFAMVVARIGAILGNLIFGQLIDANCAIPLIMVSVMLVFGGFVSIFIPETSGTTLK